MAFIEVPNTLMVEYKMSLLSQFMEITQYWYQASEWSEAEAEDLVADLKTWWQTELSDALSNQVNLDAIKYTNLESASSFTGEYSTGLPVTGGIASNSLPSNCAAVVTQVTSARGRSFRGRNYVPGIPEANVGGNVIDNSILVSLQAAYDSLILIGIDHTCAPVVVSRYSGGAPRATGIVTAIRSYVPRSTIRTQRRRLPSS